MALVFWVGLLTFFLVENAVHRGKLEREAKQIKKDIREIGLDVDTVIF